MSLGGVVQTVRDATGSEPSIAFEDPVADVEAAFAAALQREAGLSATHAPDRAALRDGLLFDFVTVTWKLPFVSRSFVSSARTTYGLEFAVLGRLRRLPEKTVLWTGLCSFHSGDAPRPWGELEADGFALLAARRAEVAKDCADQLMGSFLGRTEWSGWSGRNEPGAR